MIFRPEPSDNLDSLDQAEKPLRLREMIRIELFLPISEPETEKRFAFVYDVQARQLGGNGYRMP
jgi:hypothetical protein